MGTPPQPTHRVTVGEHRVAHEGWIGTLLGSCVAACVWCPATRLGGLNHFLLPDGAARMPPDGAGRFGVHAMELLVNAMLRRGAPRARLQFKIAGGARLGPGPTDAGARNVEFVRAYLLREGFPIVAEDVGGTCGRSVRYEACTGRLLTRRLDAGAIRGLVAGEHRAGRDALRHRAAAGTVERVR